MAQGNARQRIFRAVVEELPLLQLPQAWHALRLEHDVLCEPRTSPPLLTALGRRFSADELLNAGVTVRGRRDDPVLHSLFNPPNTCIVPIRHSRGGSPVALCAENAHLPATPCAPRVMFDDVDTQYAMGVSGNRLLVVFSGVDLAIMRGLGLPAIFGNSLPGLSRVELQALADSFGWTYAAITPAFHDDVADFVDGLLAQTDEARPDAGVENAGGYVANETDVNEENSDDECGTHQHEQSPERLVPPGMPHLALAFRPQVVLVDFNLCALSAERSPACQQAITLLRDVGSTGRFDLSRVGIWRPTLDELSTFANHQRHGTRESLLEAMPESLASSTRALTNADEQSEPSLVEALRRHRELTDSGDSAERIRARRDLAGAIDQHFQASIAFAERYTDPVRRSGTMLLADLFRELQLKSMLNPARQFTMESERHINSIIKLLKAIK